MDLDLNGGEWRLLSETHNPPAGRHESSDRICDSMARLANLYVGRYLDLL
jgi:hypothetical protein